MSDHRGTAISALHDDVIGAHILTRLDGVSLSSFTRASSHFRSVAAAYEHQLWGHVCTSTWPSTNDPRVQRAITSFPNRHRGFFSKSYPLLTGHVTYNRNRSSSSLLTEELISAVDIYYKTEPVFSRVVETETVSGWFAHSPFRIDLLGPKESVRVGFGYESELAESMELSWIVIDPVRKVSASLSSFRHVATERNWLTEEVSVKYSTVVGVDRVVEVEVKVEVTCNGEVHMREVGMRVEDVEGKWMNGKESLRVLGEVMECGERKVSERGVGGRGRERYGEFLERKIVWREEKERRERKMGITCIGGVVFVLGFCMVFFLSR